MKIVGKSYPWPIFKRVRDRSRSKNYWRSLLSVVSKIFEKLANKRFAKYLEKFGHFLFFVWFQVFSVDCRSSDSCI